MSSNKVVPANLIAFPSVSSSLNSLPQATSIQNVALHPNMYAQRAAESEEKLRNALLAKPPSGFSSPHPSYPSSQNMQTMPSLYAPSSQTSQSQSPQDGLMMRQKAKFST